MLEILFKDKHGTPVSHFTQWDNNQSLFIHNWNYDNVPTIHFFNRNMKQALVVKSELFAENIVKANIPNILLETPCPINVCIYLSDGDSSSKTIHIEEISVRPRAKPEDYEFVENIEYVNWVELEVEARALIDELNSIEVPQITAERFEAANYWEMSSQDASGNAVWLYPGNSGSAGYPNRAAAYSRLNLTAGSEENTFSIVANDADVSNMDSCYLYFDRSSLRWDRVSAPGSNATWKTNTSLRLYRAAMEGENSSTEIPGYVRVTSLGYVTEGRYLIAAPGNDGGIYLLYPSTATANRYQQTAKVIDGNTAGIGSDNSYSAGTVALTDCLYTFGKNAESWESGVHLTVTNPGTDGQEDTRTAVRVLDGKDGIPGKPGSTVSTAPKPVFVISANYNGGVYWMHQYSGEPATVEELVDAFFGGGIYKNDANSLARNQGAFGISGDGVRYTGCLIYGATEEQYLAALSKYLPEGADAV